MCRGSLVVGRKPGKLVGLSPSGVRISPSASCFSYFDLVQVFQHFFRYFLYYFSLFSTFFVQFILFFLHYFYSIYPQFFTLFFIQFIRPCQLSVLQCIRFQWRTGADILIYWQLHVKKLISMCCKEAPLRAAPELFAYS